jgi:hypothetical protein
MFRKVDNVFVFLAGVAKPTSPGQLRQIISGDVSWVFSGLGLTGANSSI